MSEQISQTFSSLNLSDSLKPEATLICLKNMGISVTEG